MRWGLLISFIGVTALIADPAVDRARELMRSGDSKAARAALQSVTRNNPRDAEAALAWAEYLDHYRQAGAADAYRAALPLLSGTQKTAAERRLRVLEAYSTKAASDTAQEWPTIPIPGPIRSFARMAALSPDLPKEQILSALARNIMTNGYQASGSEEGMQQTEYLKLVYRYLTQARELEKLAGDTKMLKVPACESTETGELLRILGYRMRGGCGSDLVLETVNASRAFLTIDSGFPLAELEQALRQNRPFEYDYHPSEIPVFYGPQFWQQANSKNGFIDDFMSDPQNCRLYLGLSKLDRETADALKAAMTPVKLKAYAHIIDFYGGMFQMRGGKAVIPGGPKATKVWGDIVGTSPDQGAAFFEKLIAKDDGWLASYFDSISRIEGPLRDYLMDADRVKRYYTAIRGRITSPGPARPVFRANTDMIMLTTRMRLEADGRPHIPGNIDVWRNLFIKHPHGKYDGKLTRLASGWKEPDDLVEALFALTRKVVDNEPLRIYLALSDVNRRRATPISAATAERLVLDYKKYGTQFPLLAEFPELSDATIIRLLDKYAEVDKVRDTLGRCDAAGITQGLIGLWQIAARQGLIEGAKVDATLNAVLDSLTGLEKSEQLFDSGRKGLGAILAAAGLGKGTDIKQQDALRLLAGGTRAADEDTQQDVVTSLARLFEQQRLVSLDTLFELAADLEGVSKGQKFNAALANKLAARISEVNLPRPALSGAERNSQSFGYYTERHIEEQRRFNLRQKIDKAGTDAAKLEALRGELTPILRDTIVGFNYLFYAPPGAQIMLTNPLFVRSHDFVGMQGAVATWRNTEVYGSGWPSSAGGRLSGSLVNLPYALAEAEQNFMIPTREQALIWGDLVPQMVVTAKVPRWWTTSRQQLHFVSLAMQLGEEMLAEGALDAAQREVALREYERLAPPSHSARVAAALSRKDFRAALAEVQPSELFLMGLRNFENGTSSLAAELRAIRKANPQATSTAAISRAFGSPKPTLLHSYSPEIVGLRTFPTLMGYSSRIMAESWESNSLYFAALADELGIEPARLNLLVPSWTQKTVERIFATHLEDWPALLRSLRYVGDQIRSTGPAQAGLE